MSQNGSGGAKGSFRPRNPSLRQDTFSRSFNHFPPHAPRLPANRGRGGPGPSLRFEPYPGSISPRARNSTPSAFTTPPPVRSGLGPFILEAHHVPKSVTAAELRSFLKIRAHEAKSRPVNITAADSSFVIEFESKKLVSLTVLPCGHGSWPAQFPVPTR